MNLSFFTKIFGRSVQLSSSFGKTFSYVRDACEYKDKVFKADIYNENNTCTSCVFNGFKYMSVITVSIHCPPEMSEIDCICRIESFWPKFLRGCKYFGMFPYS